MAVTGVGDASRASLIETRFWSKVEEGPTSEFRPDLGPCWLWTDKPHSKGYGRFHIRTARRRPVRMLAHRFAYEILVGRIPVGLVLDHLCRVTTCVNPGHLEPVTQEENRRRGFAWLLNRVNHQTAKDRCPKDHLYDEANTYIDTKGHRRCRRCNRERMARKHRTCTPGEGCMRTGGDCA